MTEFSSNYITYHCLVYSCCKVFAITIASGSLTCAQWQQFMSKIKQLNVHVLSDNCIQISQAFFFRTHLNWSHFEWTFQMSLSCLRKWWWNQLNLWEKLKYDVFSWCTMQVMSFVTLNFEKWHKIALKCWGEKQQKSYFTALKIWICLEGGKLFIFTYIILWTHICSTKSPQISMNIITD